MLPPWHCLPENRGEGGWHPQLCCVFVGCGQAQPAWRAQMQEGSLEEEVLQKMSCFLV